MARELTKLELMEKLDLNKPRYVREVLENISAGRAKGFDPAKKTFAAYMYLYDCARRGWVKEHRLDGRPKFTLTEAGELHCYKLRRRSGQKKTGN